MLPNRKPLTLQAGTRAEMEQWIAAFRRAMAATATDASHNWYFASGARGTFCNVCGHSCHSLSAKTLACEVCMMRVHRGCAAKMMLPCKWTTQELVPLAQAADNPVPTVFLYIHISVLLRSFSFLLSLARQAMMHHQWLTGNVSGKCAVCQKSCGSSSRLQDFRCTWCRAVVHGVCRLLLPSTCTFGRHCVSILPVNNKGEKKK